MKQIKPYDDDPTRNLDYRDSFESISNIKKNRLPEQSYKMVALAEDKKVVVNVGSREAKREDVQKSDLGKVTFTENTTVQPHK